LTEKPGRDLLLESRFFFVLASVREEATAFCMNNIKPRIHIRAESKRLEYRIGSLNVRIAGTTLCGAAVTMHDLSRAEAQERRSKRHPEWAMQLCAVCLGKLATNSGETKHR
jgi:hypothetical protein